MLAASLVSLNHRLTLDDYAKALAGDVLARRRKRLLARAAVAAVTRDAFAWQLPEGVVEAVAASPLEALEARVSDRLIQAYLLWLDDQDIEELLMLSEGR